MVLGNACKHLRLDQTIHLQKKRWVERERERERERGEFSKETRMQLEKTDNKK
jgi:hypothetical protein